MPDPEMRLLVLSNMAHYRKDGSVVGWGPTAEELSHVAALFEEVVHVGCLHEGNAPASFLPYTAPNVRLHLVPPAGGPRLRDKLRIGLLAPLYLGVMLKELSKAEAVHVRAPANVSLLAMMLLAFVRRPRRRWIKYAGNWRPQGSEPWSYRFQRWWLRRNFARAQVTVNGRWPGDPPHIHPFPNPCMTLKEYENARQVAALKRLTNPPTLLFVGALTRRKGASIALRALAHLRTQGIQARLVVAGDGPERTALTEDTRALGLKEATTFLGFVPHPEMGRYYAEASFVLSPSASEGWPKVLGEGMAYGAVPIASAVSSIPQVLQEAKCGRCLDSWEPQVYGAAIQDYLCDPDRWRREALAGSAYAERFTYEGHVARVAKLLEIPLTFLSPGVSS